MRNNKESEDDEREVNTVGHAKLDLLANSPEKIMEMLTQLGQQQESVDKHAPAPDTTC